MLLRKPTNILYELEKDSLSECWSPGTMCTVINRRLCAMTVRHCISWQLDTVYTMNASSVDTQKDRHYVRHDNRHWEQYTWQTGQALCVPRQTGIVCTMTDTVYIHCSVDHVYAYRDRQALCGTWQTGTMCAMKVCNLTVCTVQGCVGIGRPVPGIRGPSCRLEPCVTWATQFDDNFCFQMILETRI